MINTSAGDVLQTLQIPNVISNANAMELTTEKKTTSAWFLICIRALTPSSHVRSFNRLYVSFSQGRKSCSLMANPWQSDQAWHDKPLMMRTFSSRAEIHTASLCNLVRGKCCYVANHLWRRERRHGKLEAVCLEDNVCLEDGRGPVMMHEISDYVRGVADSLLCSRWAIFSSNRQ